MRNCNRPSVARSNNALFERELERHQRNKFDSRNLDVAVARSLASAASSRVHLGIGLALELVVQDAGENVVSELRVFQAQRLELGLRLGAEGVGSVRPEIGDRRADGCVGIGGVGIDIAGVGDLALGCGVDAVDLGGGEGAQVGDLELVGQGVDAGVLEELLAGLVDLGKRGVIFELSLARNLPGEVVAGVEVFEEAADCVDFLRGELDLARAAIVAELSASVLKEWAQREEGLVGSQDGLGLARADDQGNYGAGEVADE